MLTSVLVVFTSLRDDSSDFIAAAQYDEVAAVVRSAIVQAYENGQFADYVRINVKLPEVLGGAPYRVSLINRTNDSIVVENLYGGLNRTLDLLNVNATVFGFYSSTGSGPCSLVYNKSSGNLTMGTI